MEFSIKDFSGKCDQIRSFREFGHIYWRNPYWKIFCAVKHFAKLIGIRLCVSLFLIKFSGLLLRNFAEQIKEHLWATGLLLNRAT